MMRGKLNWYVIGAVALASILNLGAPPANAQGIAEKVEVCAGCHGVDGKPIDKLIPAIWGQQLGYLYIQLRDFKRGDRKNEIMQPIASAMERDEMLAIAEYFSKKPWPNLGQPRAPKEVATRALRANGSGGGTGWPLRQFPGGGHGAAPGGHEQGIHDQNHRRVSLARARQQSRHVRPDDCHRSAGPCRAGGISVGTLNGVQGAASRSRNDVSLLRSAARFPALSCSDGSAPRANNRLAIPA